MFLGSSVSLSHSYRNNSSRSHSYRSNSYRARAALLVHGVKAQRLSVPTFRD